MFTINIYLRFALIALCLFGGTLLAVFNSFWYALPILLVGIVLLVGYFLLGTVQSAAQIMQTGDLDAAEQRLNMTYMPNWLFVYNRAYFFLLKGTIAMQRNEQDNAEKLFIKAESLGLPSDNEKGLVAIYLCGINLQRERWTVAENYLKKAKSLNISESMLTQQVKDMEMALKNRGQIKLARQMQMQNRGQMMMGGKRRRPPVR